MQMSPIIFEVTSKNQKYHRKKYSEQRVTLMLGDDSEEFKLLLIGESNAPLFFRDCLWTV